MASDTTDTGAGTGDATAGQAEPRKSLPLYFSLQFIKDLSFENPRAPEVYENFQEPEVNINVNVGARNLSGRSFEVTLRLSIDAKGGGETTFLVELEYCGIAHVGPDVEDQAVQPLVLIEGPRMLFPFARAIIANLTRDAAYPLLLLGQMDFVEMYRNGIQQAQRGRA
ncbi:MAG: protein-export chaperone SecB [Alphaproteobacteria bacterium]